MRSIGMGVGYFLSCPRHLPVGSISPNDWATGHGTHTRTYPIQLYTCTNVHTQTYKHTHARARTHIHIHTHTHTHRETDTDTPYHTCFFGPVALN